MLLPEARIAQCSRPCEEISHCGSCTTGTFRRELGRSLSRLSHTASKAPNKPNLSSMSDAGTRLRPRAAHLCTAQLQARAGCSAVLLWVPARHRCGTVVTRSARPNPSFSVSLHMPCAVPPSAGGCSVWFFDVCRSSAACSACACCAREPSGQHHARVAGQGQSLEALPRGASTRSSTLSFFFSSDRPRSVVATPSVWDWPSVVSADKRHHSR